MKRAPARDAGGRRVTGQSLGASVTAILLALVLPPLPEGAAAAPPFTVEQVMRAPFGADPVAAPDAGAPRTAGGGPHTPRATGAGRRRRCGSPPPGAASPESSAWATRRRW